MGDYPARDLMKMKLDLFLNLFAVEYCTDERESQEMSLPSVAVRIRHNLEYLNPTIDVFDQYPIRGQQTIRQFLFRRQRMLFALLKRNLTIRMKC